MRRHILVITLVLALASGAVPFSIGSARASGTHGYVVVFAGQQAADGAFDLTVSHEAILSLVASAGGTIIADLSAQSGVLVVESANPLFAAVLRGSVLVEEVGQDFGWKAVPTYDEAVASGAPGNVGAAGGPSTSAFSTPESTARISTSTTMASLVAPRTWTARGAGTSFRLAPASATPGPASTMASTAHTWPGSWPPRRTG